MNVRSIGLATELSLVATRGQIIDRGDYLAVRTPDDPSFYYGNALILPSPPQRGTVASWSRRFSEELGDNPEIRHVTLCWDGITGDAGARDELEAAGFVIETNQVMITEQLVDVVRPPGIRVLDTDELGAVGELAFAVSDRHDQAHWQFIQRRTAWQRQLIARGVAEFWGAFDGDQLVGSLGLVTLSGLARYQDVQTATTHRKRGIASALLVAAGSRALARGIERLVIIAMPETAAASFYQRIGFRPIELTASACRHPSSLSESAARS
ncbi:MAG: GNAT family N-acetyltransferase [Kofleriaceae bacterium]